MTGSAGADVLLVHASTPDVDPEALSGALGPASVSTASVASVVEDDDTVETDCLVIDPTIPESSAAAVLSAVAERNGSLPVIYCVDGGGQIAVPSHPIDAELVVLDDPGETEPVAAAIRSRLPGWGPTPEVPTGDYRRLFAGAPVAMVVYDEAGRLVFANEAAARLVGAETPDAVRGEPIETFVPESAVQFVQERVSRVIDDREAVESVDLELRTVDGDRRYVEATTVPVTYRGSPAGHVVLNDVTERQRRERSLQAERDRLDALFESVPEPVVHVRFEDDRPVVHNTNAAFEETFGYATDQLRGESLNDYIVPPDRRVEARAIDHVARDDRGIEREIVRETPSGERTFVFRSVVVDTGDETTEAIGAYADITDQKERERALERKNERLEAFANIVSHDLRNPLNVISGRLELARETGDEEHFEALAAATGRMGELIDDLLALARQGETVGDVRTVELAPVVEDAWAGVDTGGAELVIEDPLGDVEADRSRLCELFENLFRNAMEHAADGGRDTTVRVGREDHLLYVADDGPGIPESEREQVFDLGYTTADDGTGYGLAIVAEIAEAHGWSVEVTDAASGGARFEFDLDG